MSWCHFREDMRHARISALDAWLFSLEIGVYFSKISVHMYDTASLFPRELSDHHDNDVVTI